jgi:tRNA(Ile)-lysidine synthase
MINAKIPEHIRDYLPLVMSPQHIIWVAGWRIDERVKITDQTVQVLWLEFTQAGKAQSGSPSANSCK